MKWVNVTLDTVVDNRSIIRFKGTKFLLSEWRYFIKTYPHRIDTLEMLDESAESDTESELREQVKKLRDYLLLVTHVYEDGTMVSRDTLNDKAKQLLAETDKK